MEKDSVKIIFLDIDGVLNVGNNERDEFGHLFRTDLVENLEHIIKETDAKIVISSTWRMDGIETMQRMWEMRDLPGKVIGVTTTCAQLITDDQPYLDMVERGHEIQEYIDSNKIKQYVILDDCNDMLDTQQKNFVKCSGNKHHGDSFCGLGLTKMCAAKAVAILNKNC